MAVDRKEKNEYRKSRGEVDTEICALFPVNCLGEANCTAEIPDENGITEYVHSFSSLCSCYQQNHSKMRRNKPAAKISFYLFLVKGTQVLNR